MLQKIALVSRQGADVEIKLCRLLTESDAFRAMYGNGTSTVSRVSVDDSTENVKEFVTYLKHHYTLKFDPYEPVFHFGRVLKMLDKYHCKKLIEDLKYQVKSYIDKERNSDHGEMVGGKFRGVTFPSKQTYKLMEDLVFDMRDIKINYSINDDFLD